MIAAGLGFTSAASEPDILLAIVAALQQHKLSQDALSLLASIEDKRDSTALASAAEQLDIPLIFIKHARLRATSQRVLTRSELSIAATGLPSVSEAAALAAAGKNARLLGARLITGGVTCALAQATADDTTNSDSPGSLRQ